MFLDSPCINRPFQTNKRRRRHKKTGTSRLRYCRKDIVKDCLQDGDTDGDREVCYFQWGKSCTRWYLSYGFCWNIVVSCVAQIEFKNCLREITYLIWYFFQKQNSYESFYSQDKYIDLILTPNNVIASLVFTYKITWVWSNNLSIRKK